MDKKQAIEWIDQKQDVILNVSDKVWEYAELSLKEYKSMDLYCQVLEDEGFTVEKGVSGVPTAFTGTFGQGRPYIGILGEFDALSGLSQQAACPKHTPLVEGGSGHGCGHNMLGAGSLAAAFAVKRYLEEKKIPGTVIYYGCPGEEGGAGKAFMARNRVFEKLDAAFCWHPEDMNAVNVGTCNSSLQVEYTFHGVSAHAAGDPHLGRSALDAVELMNTGVQYLREHMPRTDCLHYAITDAGGMSPNVVQAKATVLYMVRSDTVPGALKLLERVNKIANGAALMTETTVTTRFIDGTADLRPNSVLEQVLYNNFEALGVPQHTDEERAFAQALVDSYENPDPDLPSASRIEGEDILEFVREHSKNGTEPLNDYLLPYRHSTKMHMGSTDVGDVSWLTPTAQIVAVCFASKAPGHSWQNVSAGRSSIGHKGLLHAGKVLAGAVIDCLENPALLTAARAEFDATNKGGYVCPIPADAVPIAL